MNEFVNRLLGIIHLIGAFVIVGIMSPIFVMLYFLGFIEEKLDSSNHTTEEQRKMEWRSL